MPVVVARRHSLSGASGGAGIEGEIGPAAREVASRFTQYFTETIPTNSPNPTTNLQQHMQRLTAMAQTVQTLAEGMGRQSTGSDTRITVLQSVPDTPEIQQARDEYIQKSSVADNLEVDAGNARSRATDLREAATDAKKQVETTRTDRDDAEGVARAKDAAATKAEDAAKRAMDAANLKGKQATDAETKADSAGQDAVQKRGEAEKAQETARTAQAQATAKSGDADKAEGAAREARDAATETAREAERAEGAVAPLRERATALREAATRAATAAAGASDKDRPAAQAEAQRAQSQASEAEAAVDSAQAAAKQARAAADQAAGHADRLDTHAQTLRRAATGLQGEADRTRNDAATLHAAAQKAEETASALAKTATGLRDEAKTLLTAGQSKMDEAKRLRGAANTAKQVAQDAAAKHEQAQTRASRAEEDASRAETEAREARQAAEAARQESVAAGRALREIIDRTPVPPEPADTTTTRRRTSETAEPTAAEGADTAAAAERSALMQGLLNVAAVSGQQMVAVGLTTALREAVAAGVEALLTHTEASDEAKAGIAGGLYASVILANVMAVCYHHQQKIGTEVTHAGNIAQIVSLIAALASSASTGTLKDLVPSLVKTFAYSGGRDVANIFMPLSDNLREDGANPLMVQAVNALFYSGNQMLVNAIQGFHGVSGAGLDDNLHKNATDPNTHEEETLNTGFASLAAYVVGNYGGELVDQLTGRALNQWMSGGNIADLQIEMKAPSWPGAQQAWDTFAADGVSRTSVFYSVYGLSAAINPNITQDRFGETGALWLQSFVGGALIALMTLPALMTVMKKGREAFGGGERGGRQEEGEARITSASTPEGSPERTGRGDDIALQPTNRGEGSNRNRGTGASPDNRV